LFTEVRPLRLVIRLPFGVADLAIDNLLYKRVKTVQHFIKRVFVAARDGGKGATAARGVGVLRE
jgi:hypothetical protein